MMVDVYVNPSRKNGDESSKEAAAIAATAVPDGIRAAVSHAAGLEASPAGDLSATVATPVGFTTPGVDLEESATHDLAEQQLAMTP